LSIPKYFPFKPSNQSKQSNNSRFDPFRGVGKWKIRKKISGGADAHLFTIKNGEPDRKESYENFSQRFARRDQESSSLQQSSTLQESEGTLAFVNPPDPNDPQDHNKDGIYEVVLGYVNTTLGDTRVPVPELPSSLTVTDTTSVNIADLSTIITPMDKVDPRRIHSDTDADGYINSVDPDDDGDRKKVTKPSHGQAFPSLPNAHCRTNRDTQTPASIASNANTQLLTTN
jgi:hypothetical protein